MINGIMLIFLIVFEYHSSSYGAKSFYVSAFKNINQFLTAKLLKQGYPYHKFHKAFSKFYRRR